MPITPNLSATSSKDSQTGVKITPALLFGRATTRKAHSVSVLRKLFQQNAIRVNGMVVGPDTRVFPGDVIELSDIARKCV